MNPVSSLPSVQTGLRAFLATALIASAAVVALQPASAASREGDAEFEFTFDDEPRRRDVGHPAWFELSFLDLEQDLQRAVDRGKRGLMVYFGQAHCAYCDALMKVNFQDPDIVAFTRKHFDVVALDIFGDREVVTMDGRQLTEKELAAKEKTTFTPSIIFYDSKGEKVFRLRGYYPPYKFRAALEYVADEHYRRETFRDYLLRADPPPVFEIGDMVHEEFFSPPPYALDRSRFSSDRPLVVFFEQRMCHGCDVLHTAPLSEPKIKQMLERAEVIQLDMWSDTPVLTPDGRRLTARQWAADLGIFYAPSLVFFDERGKEIIRVDSVVRLYRLQRVVRYVMTKAYLKHPNFQRWRLH